MLQVSYERAQYELLQIPRPAVVSRAVGKENHERGDSSPKQLDAVQNFMFLTQRADTLRERIDYRNNISQTYANWISMINLDQRIALVGVLRSVLWIVVIIAGSFLAFSLFSRLTANAHTKSPQQNNLRIAGRFVLQAGAVVLVLVVIFGPPKQLQTAVFGIIGAGLTIAVKNFASTFVDSRLRGLIKDAESEAVETEPEKGKES